MKMGRRKSVQAIILAGGKGTRLRPLALSTHKSVAPLAKRPFLTPGGGVRYAAGGRSGTLAKFNGDVLTDLDLRSFPGRHRRSGSPAGRRAKIGAPSSLGGHAVLGDHALLPEYSRIGGGDSGSLP